MTSARTLGDLVQDYVRTQCDELRETRGAISERDESAVHPSRVAIRRLRATLRTFRAVYDRDEASAFAAELQWAGGLLGEVRDLQVLADRFAAAGSVVHSGAGDILAAQIDRDRARAWDRAGRGLGSPRGAALYGAISRWRDEPPFHSRADRPATRVKKPVAEADATVRKRLRRAEEASLTRPGEVAGLLHDARKAVKRHRYAVELALPVLGEDAEKTVARRQALQDALGAHQDAVVALSFLRRIDLDALNRETALSLEELIGYTRARAEDVGGVLRETRLLHAQ